jgi:uncharacterized membrane-anchored protein
VISGDRGASVRQMLNKVPEVTLYFWVIKVLCTTVGETASDYLSGNVGLGLTKTTFITAALLVATLVFQFRSRRYLAGIYWTGIVLISVVGTQITDNLSDNYGVSLVTTTTVFSLILALVFAVWFASERTLSIHTIYTSKREGFYWLAVLFTFALGTAAGDLIAERLSVGYVWSLVLFAGAIALVAALHYWLNLNAVLAFWMAYILTRPLGASTGDLLSQARRDGGLGLGTTVTSFAFLAAILVVVAYLSMTKRDVAESPGVRQADLSAEVLVVAHRMTAATPALLEAIRTRVERGAASFHLLVPNPAEHAEITDSERARVHLEGEHALALALPLIDQAAGRPVTGSVSARHDPMDAIEEMLRVGGFHEIILSTPPHHISSLLHADLAHRVAHLGIPLTTVTATARRSVEGRRQELLGEA